MQQDELQLAGEAAQTLGLSAERVRQLGAAGRLTVLRTQKGTRLFLRAEVEALAVQRQQQREQREAATA